MVSYSSLNHCNREICIYRIGNHAGFFAEINNLIIAVIYCLENNKRFVLYSENGLYCNDMWLDFFLPFTEHAKYSFQDNGARISGSLLQKSSLNKNEVTDVTKFLEDGVRNDVSVFSTLIWPFIKRKIIYIPSYQFKSQFLSENIIHAGYRIIQSIWHFNPVAHKKVLKIKQSLKIQTPYVGLHIRRGDKHTEVVFKSVEEYLIKVNKITKQLNFPVFIATDDQRVLNEIKKISPKRPLYYFQYPERNGFDMADFSSLNKEHQNDNIIQLLAEVDMLINADLFVGTFTSNVGMFIAMARDGKEIYGVDTEEWRIWQ